MGNYFDTKRRLEAFARRDRSRMPIDEIAEALRPTIKGHTDNYARFDPGPIVCRSRIIDPGCRPSRSSKLSYPPSHVCRMGRVNRDGEAIFYGSNGIIATVYEVQAKQGDHVALASWRLVQSVLIARAGYSDDNFNRLGSKRSVSRDVETDRRMKVSRDKAQTLIHEFICREFTMVDSQNGGLAYKTSIALFDLLARSKMMNGIIDTGIKIDGMNYPSVALRADDTNIALFPPSADRALRLYEAHVFRVNEISPKSVDVTYLDEGREGVPTGDMTWSGHRPAWTDTSDGRVVFRDTDTGWRVFHPDGRELRMP